MLAFKVAFRDVRKVWFLSRLGVRSLVLLTLLPRRQLLLVLVVRSVVRFFFVVASRDLVFSLVLLRVLGRELLLLRLVLGITRTGFHLVFALVLHDDFSHLLLRSRSFVRLVCSLALVARRGRLVLFVLLTARRRHVASLMRERARVRRAREIATTSRVGYPNFFLKHRSLSTDSSVACGKGVIPKQRQKKLDDIRESDSGFYPPSLWRRTPSVQFRKHDNVHPDSVQHEQGPSDPVREDNGRERQENLLEHVQSMMSSASLLQPDMCQMIPPPEPIVRGGTHSTFERFERVHALFVFVLVLPELLVAPYDVRKPSLLPRRHTSRVISVRLQVPHLLVQLEVVGLERFDLGAKFRDRVELTTQFLVSRVASGILLGRDDDQKKVALTSSSSLFR